MSGESELRHLLRLRHRRPRERAPSIGARVTGCGSREAAGGFLTAKQAPTCPRGHVRAAGPARRGCLTRGPRPARPGVGPTGPGAGRRGLLARAGRRVRSGGASDTSTGRARVARLTRRRPVVRPGASIRRPWNTYRSPRARLAQVRGHPPEVRQNSSDRSAGWCRSRSGRSAPGSTRRAPAGADQSGDGGRLGTGRGAADHSAGDDDLDGRGECSASVGPPRG